MNHFSSKFFVGNRQKLIKSIDSDIAVVSANAILQRNGDSSYPYRQDSNFWYLCGVNDPGYSLVITKTRSYLISPQLTRVQRVFDEQDTEQAIKDASGVDEVISYKEGWKLLKNQLSKSKRVAAPKRMDLHHWGVTPNPSRGQLIAKLRRICPGIDIEDIRAKMSELRMVKQPEELRAIQAAIDITNETLKDVFSQGWYKKYRNENEIEAEIGYGFRKRGAKGHAFGPVIASGQAACTLHYQSNDGKINSGDLLVADVGAEINNYAADITRTFVASDKMSKRQKEVFNAVLEVQKFGISRLKPGVTVIENEKAIEAYMGKVLKKLGLIKTTDKKSIRKYYPHATSHMLGLDPHDAAIYSKPLKPGMVLTVEPGIYIPEEGIGVRIEDDVLITKTGAKVLSAKLPANGN